MGWGERWWQGQLLSQKPSFSSQPSSLGSSLLSAAAAAADNSTKLYGLKSISNQTIKERKQTNVSLYYAPDIVLKGLHGISNRICKTKMWNARKLDFWKWIFFFIPNVYHYFIISLEESHELQHKHTFYSTYSWFPCVAQMVKKLPAMQEAQV